MKAFAVAISLAGLVACSGTDHPPSTVTFERSDAVLYVEIAEKAHEQRMGLMGVETLPEDEGMAFVFDEPSDTTFWMKDTLIPLSIAFFDAQGSVVSILDMEPCHTETCPLYDSGMPAKGAVEVEQGYFADHGVEVGDAMTLSVATA